MRKSLSSIYQELGVFQSEFLSNRLFVQKMLWEKIGYFVKRKVHEWTVWEESVILFGVFGRRGRLSEILEALFAIICCIV